MTRVVVVDDHRLLAQMLVDRLRHQSVEGLALDVTEHGLASRIRSLEPDLVLLDAVFGQDEDGGMNVLTELRDTDDATPRVAILTGVVDQLRHARFLERGADAVISKAAGFDDVIAQVNDVLHGRDAMGATVRARLSQLLLDHDARADRHDAILDHLTGRERATLQAMVDGYSAEEIALGRTVAVSTVRSQIKAVLRKLDAHSQLEAVALAVRLGMRPANEEPAA